MLYQKRERHFVRFTTITDGEIWINSEQIQVVLGGGDEAVYIKYLADDDEELTEGSSIWLKDSWNSDGKPTKILVKESPDCVIDRICGKDV